MTENELGMEDVDQAPATDAKPIVSVTDFDNYLKELAELVVEADKQKKLSSQLNVQVEARRARCAQYLKETNRDSYKSPYGTVSLVETWNFTNPQSDQAKEEFFAHLREKGIFMKYATVNNKSLNSYCLAEMKAAEKEGRMDFLPPGIEAPKVRETIRVTKAGVK